MAVYGISASGISSLRQLAKDMNSINDEIDMSGRKLRTTVSGLGDRLGIYEHSIVAMIDNVNVVHGKGREAVTELAAKINQLASDIEALAGMGL